MLQGFKRLIIEETVLPLRYYRLRLLVAIRFILCHFIIVIVIHFQARIPNSYCCSCISEISTSVVLFHRDLSPIMKFNTTSRFLPECS